MATMERSEEVGRDFPVRVSVHRQVDLSEDLNEIVSRRVTGIEVRIEETRPVRLSIGQVTSLRDLLTAAIEAAGTGLIGDAP